MPIRSNLARTAGSAALAAILASFALAQTPPQPLTLEGDVARGETLAYTCSGCHGIPGAVNVYPTYHVPKLGGQHADYLEVALMSYRAGLRGHATMHAQASQLSDQDIADLAAYFASLEGEPQKGISGPSAATVAAGRESAMTCRACHGETGIAPSALWPNLAGQHVSYLVESLKQYRSGERESAIMAPLVGSLDDETLEELAAFYAAQPGLFESGR